VEHTVIILVPYPFVFLVKMQAVVSDGVTLGHPCCAIHDCKIPLTSHRDRYCMVHHHLHNKCAIDGCDTPRTGQNWTCDREEHRAMETSHFARAKALFQLRETLKRAGISSSDDSVMTDVAVNEHEHIVGDLVQECDEKLAEGNRKQPKARFARRRTHNEQLVVRPCGVILSRATFFGSEAVSAVRVCHFLSNDSNHTHSNDSGICRANIPHPQVHAGILRV
jgi:hypothetical protein